MHEFRNQMTSAKTKKKTKQERYIMFVMKKKTG